MLTLPWAAARLRGSLLTFAAALMLAAAGLSHAAALVEDATLVGEQTAPVTREFEIPLAGRYELQLADVGFPTALQSVQAAVTRGDTLVASVAAPGIVQFDATPGSHAIQVAGIASTASSFGSFSVRVVPVSGGNPALDYSNLIETPTPPPATGQSARQTQFVIAAAGTYRASLSDAGFPENLAQIDLLITRGGVEYTRLDGTNNTKQFAAEPGTYDVLVVAQAGALTEAGLYGVLVTNVGNGEVVSNESFPVGDLAEGRTAQLAADATYTLTVTDLQFPAALASAGAAVTRGTSVLASRTTAGSASFNATSGAIRVYALPVATQQAVAGALLAEILQGTNRVFSDAYISSPPATTNALSILDDEVVIANSGSYRATLTDFQFPGALATLEMAIFQNGVSLGRRAGTGPIDFQGASGTALLLVAAEPSPVVGLGLFGVQVAGEPSGPVVYETTQAVGGLFQSRAVDIATAGSYDVRLTDLVFPVAFTELAMAVTRGTTRVGFVYGSGKFSFNATPGEYFLNFIARVNPSAKFGTYGLKVETTPPAPVVVITANPVSVKSGESATLSWTATGATSCVASEGWTGSRATSGTQSVGPLTVESRFTLTCTGPGGSSSAATTVTIRKPSSGGGGAIDLLLLATLLGFGASMHRTRSGPR
jgi:hypothetical protein